MGAVSIGVGAISSAIVGASVVALFLRVKGVGIGSGLVWGVLLFIAVGAAVVQAVRRCAGRLDALAVVDRFYDAGYLVPTAWDLLTTGSTVTDAESYTIERSLARLERCDPASVVSIVVPRRIVLLPAAVISAVLISLLFPVVEDDASWEGPFVERFSPTRREESGDDAVARLAEELDAIRGARESRPRSEETPSADGGDIPTLDPSMRRLGAGDLLDETPGGERYEGELLSRGLLRSMPEEEGSSWVRPPRDGDSEGEGTRGEEGAAEHDSSAAEGAPDEQSDSGGSGPDRSDGEGGGAVDPRGDGDSGGPRSTEGYGEEGTGGSGNRPGEGEDGGGGAPDDRDALRLAYTPFDLPMNTEEADHSELTARAAPDGEAGRSPDSAPVVDYDRVETRLAARTNLPAEVRGYVRDYFLEIGR